MNCEQTMVFAEANCDYFLKALDSSLIRTTHLITTAYRAPAFCWMKYTADP